MSLLVTFSTLQVVCSVLNSSNMDTSCPTAALGTGLLAPTALEATLVALRVLVVARFMSLSATVPRGEEVLRFGVTLLDAGMAVLALLCANLVAGLGVVRRADEA